MTPWPVARAVARVTLAAGLVAASGCAHDQHQMLHRNGEPAITGNPAADPTLPVRLGRPGRLLLRCRAPGAETAEAYASAQDFDQGRQSFFLKRTDAAGGETLYPLHGHFLDAGASGIFMVHDGKGVQEGAGDTFRIDQSVNMGVLFFRSTDEGIQATIEVIAEETASEQTDSGGVAFTAYACRLEEPLRTLAPRPEHIHLQPNSGATPPSHWLRESDRTLLTCHGSAVRGAYRFELLGSKIWPGHLGFLVVRLPGTDQPVGYNVHLLEGAGRVLIHAHSYPHRSHERPLDRMEETETVIGGLLLHKTAEGYSGWAGFASSAADPYNISFSRDATMTDYAVQGHAVVPPLPVTCK